MSSCGGNCGCGSSCKCGSGCSCSAFADVETVTTRVNIIGGVSPMKMEGSETSFGAEGGHACKCGSNCTCNPCNC